MQLPRRSILAILTAAALPIDWLHAADVAPASVTVPEPAALLATLRRDHPRLLVSRGGFTRLKTRIDASSDLQSWAASVRKNADKILSEPPSKYELLDGVRLLMISRVVLERVYALAFTRQLTGDRKYTDRAWAELQAVAQFKDWHPKHFLDTAEMCHAVAIGYDWLYEDWTDAQRQTLRDAIVKLGLNEGLKIYRGEIRDGWWAKDTHNWNQVCNGGMLMGALAIGDVEPAVAGEVVHAALKSLPIAMHEYGPDGGWVEGPGYWSYATEYAVNAIAALTSALGSDMGLADAPGFKDTSDFPLHLTGPTELNFNFADAHATHPRTAALFWLADRFNHPEAARFAMPIERPDPRHLLWYHPPPANITAPPLDRHFRGVEVVTMRSAWDDRKAIFAGFRAGKNGRNHGHLDLGTFVLDAGGVRWAEDLGGDDYNLPGYFNSAGPRWNYYRLRAEGHNTLVINPDVKPDQNPAAATTIERFESHADRALAIADLSAAYPKLKRFRRGVAMLERRVFVVQDEVDAVQAVAVHWFMHTRAKITPSADGRSALLEHGKAKLHAELRGEPSAKFTVTPAEPLPTSPHPEKQGSNDAFSRLTISLPAVTSARWSVAFWLAPAAGATPITPPVMKDLDAW